MSNKGIDHPSYKHGFTINHKLSRLYKIWIGIKTRVNNPKNKDFNYYGGRGIKICHEWNDYVAFMKWSLENGYNDNLQIDRKDSNADYCPANCRWVDRYTNIMNRRIRSDFGIYKRGTIYRISIRRNKKLYYGGVSRDYKEAIQKRDELRNKLNPNLTL